jgi:glycosyltransferase involved in cell wall biosynthesis
MITASQRAPTIDISRKGPGCRTTRTEFAFSPHRRQLSMRILVDYRPALRARTGVGEYLHELTRAYAAMHTDEVVAFTSSWKDRPAPALAEQLHAQVVDRRIPVRVLNAAWHRFEWPPIETLAGNVDVAHAPHPLLIPARRAAQVVTIHDLFFLDHPERTHAEIRRDYPALVAAHARRADAIITSSHHVKGLVSQRLSVPAERITVCPAGAPAWRTLGRGPHLPDDGYILFVGTLEPRKNIGRLLDAYEMLLSGTGIAPPLVLAGGTSPEAETWLDRAARMPLRGHVKHIGYIAQDRREEVYAGARLLVLPSLDEGFGLPALEAMSAGIPVVVSNRGSLPEVVGDAGALVDAEDASGLASAMERVIADDNWARSRAIAGLERAARFTWNAAANNVRRAYVDALARRRAR